VRRDKMSEGSPALKLLDKPMQWVALRTAR
jgi:hypothetical protein